MDITKAIKDKQEASASLNAIFSYSGNGYQYIQTVKGFIITGTKIGKQVDENSPDESVMIQFIAKELSEEFSP